MLRDVCDLWSSIFISNVSATEYSESVLTNRHLTDHRPVAIVIVTGEWSVLASSWFEYLIEGILR